MYEAFFGFREKPFSLLPDPTFLFLTEKHRRALTLLEYGLTSQSGFTVVTGEIGSGKTTLVRKLLQDDDPNVTVGLINNTQCSSIDELLRWVAFAFNLNYSGTHQVELYDVFTDFLVQEYADGRRVVLIIDEAQQLGPELLEQVRMLSNVNADKHQVIQFILVGQPNLRTYLRRPELVQFAQRIVVDYHLQPLNEAESREYISHRLAVAGGSPEIFSPEAAALIWRHSRGVPRIINMLCDTALVYAFSEQQPRVEEALVREVLNDKSDSLAPVGERESDDSNTSLTERVNMIEKLFGN
jgi:putative secretion ATPase (PEP-CTERM system associated)